MSVKGQGRPGVPTGEGVCREEAELPGRLNLSPWPTFLQVQGGWGACRQRQACPAEGALSTQDLVLGFINSLSDWIYYLALWVSSPFAIVGLCS